MVPQSGMPSPVAARGPPYVPTVWALGGSPVRSVDLPVQSIFLVFFVMGAAVHMRIFRQNKSRGHKFLPNIFMFGFCMERILTSIVRLASVSHPTSISLAIAAQMFVSAGVVILFVINIVFAMRLVRSIHPSFGWHPAFGIAFKVLCVLLVFTIITVISASVQSFFTLNKNIQATTRGLQRFGAIFLAILATLPLPMVFATITAPYSSIDKFGVGRLRTRVFTLLISTTLLALGAWYRCGVILQAPTPRSEPLPGYLGKGAFYFFNFFVEIQTILMYAIFRVDLRWYIPDGAHGEGSYSQPQVHRDVEKQESRSASSDKTRYETQSLRTIKEDDEEDREVTTEKPTWPLGPPRIIEIDLGNASSGSLTPPPPIVPDTRRSSGRSSYARPKTADRSVRSSILSERFSVLMAKSTNTLSVFATAEQKKRWRESEEARIVRRLGGPWQQLSSPTDTSFSYSTRSPTRSGFRPSTAGSHAFEPPSPVHFRSASDAPTLPDVVSAGGWTPRIDWEFKSPQRFLSLKRKTLLGLNITT
ncbi:hypothetical protein COCCADRAFT_5972 [Bipolaris zeicola 26-R-13]|uniref:Uncharacterized protein n=1 Tax=Cochliobolus carbonum (strain 26-R-13) TaxID=930089 RepID=W6YA35_COCC2|nr:uncharacterized protein COCCADRAFT_5972 [Bipolaris zeicola 26-R-13]EUC32299.1 hypothetical protein COCCADRAFT_5972 [Bipolaris zeicola 26-R-13]